MLVPVTDDRAVHQESFHVSMYIFGRMHIKMVFVFGNSIEYTLKIFLSVMIGSVEQEDTV